MSYQVSPRAVQLLTEFEGAKPRLVAEMCEGGAYELGWGSTYHLDGRPVKPGDTATLEYAIELRAHAMTQELAPVLKALTVVPTQNQIDALACLAYNIGGSAAARSTVVKELNRGRPEDAAAAFGLWTGATNSGPAAREVLNGTVPAEPKWDEVGGRLCWLGPDGKPCDYFRRMRGLLRRHHAEGCLFLGYDWKEATKNDAIALRTRLEWNESRKRWEDQILYQTPFSEVLDVARKYPLDPLPVPAPVIEVKAEPLPEILPEPPAPKPVEKPVSVPPKPPASRPPSVPSGAMPDDFDPNAGAKAMVFSRRFWGWLLIVVGRLSFISDGGSHALSGVGGAVGNVANAIAADPMLLDMYTGMSVMFAGEAIRWWGEKKATRPLK